MKLIKKIGIAVAGAAVVGAAGVVGYKLGQRSVLKQQQETTDDVLEVVEAEIVKEVKSNEQQPTEVVNNNDAEKEQLDKEIEQEDAELEAELQNK